MKRTCKKVYICRPGRRMHSFCRQFLGIMSRKVPLIFRKYLFKEHLGAIAFISSVEKDFIVTTQDFFKYCILGCKIRNQMRINFEKRKVLQAASRNFVHKTYVFYNICFFICGQNS